MNNMYNEEAVIIDVTFKHTHKSVFVLMFSTLN